MSLQPRNSALIVQILPIFEKKTNNSQLTIYDIRNLQPPKVCLGELSAKNFQSSHFLKVKGYFFYSCTFSNLGNANEFPFKNGRQIGRIVTCDILCHNFCWSILTKKE